MKATTNAYRSIDVRRWQRDGLLVPHRFFVRQWSRDGEVAAFIRVRTEPDRVILTYCYRRDGEDWKYKSYPIYLDWTECNLAGNVPGSSALQVVADGA